MLRPKKKISKKEIKVDPLVSSYKKFLNFYEENKKKISYVLTGIIIVVIGVIIYVNNLSANNERAAAELGKIFPYYDQENYQLAINGDLNRNLPGLIKIVDEYGSTKSGKMARFYLANAYYEIGETDKALEEFDELSFSDDLLQASVYAGIGACYERKGDYIKAAKYFEKAASQSKENVLNPEYLIIAARNYGSASEKEKALDILNKVKKEYKESAAIREIDKYISAFSY